MPGDHQIWLHEPTFEFQKPASNHATRFRGQPARVCASIGEKVIIPARVGGEVSNRLPGVEAIREIRALRREGITFACVVYIHARSINTHAYEDLGQLPRKERAP